MALRILSSSDVARISSSTSAQDVVNLMALVFFRLSNERQSAGDAPAEMAMPHRISVPTAQHTALCMPARLYPFGTAIKVVSVPRSSGDARGLPASTLVLDEDTGGVKAMVNARALTAFRTAAGSALATQLVLGRDARPRRLLAVGAGAQIEAHASLLIQLYPSIDSVSVLNRTANSRAEGTLSSLRTRFPSVNFAFATLGDDLRPHVETADILVMATSSTMPLLGDAEQFVRKGAHIILVGSYTPAMHEISGALLARTRTSSSGPRALLVDSRAACLKEAGELITAGLAPSDVVEIGELLHLDGDMGYTVDPERSAALRGSSEVSIFKSVGVGVQDVAIAAYIVEKAEEMGLGVQVADYDL